MNDGDKEATLIFRALAYQLAKDIGSMAAVLRFRVDAIVYTGGMAYSESLCRDNLICFKGGAGYLPAG